MNDEETVALIAGGHTFGKTHGAGDPTSTSAPSPRARRSSEQGLGWKNSLGTGNGDDAITSGLEVTWTHTPTSGTTASSRPCSATSGSSSKSPAGAHQWLPDGPGGGRRRCPTRTTRRRRTRRRCSPPTWRCASTRSTSRSRAASSRTRTSSPTRSPAPGSSSRTATWARSSRYLGPEVPAEELLWQDPVPAVDHAARRRRRRRRAQGRHPRLGPVGLAAGVDRVGLGVHLPRHRQARRRQRCPHPPRSRRAAGRSTTPPSSRRCCAPSRASRPSSTPRTGGAQVSLADLIVLAGGVGGREGRRGGGRSRRRRCRSRRVAPTRRRSRPTSSRSPCSSRPPTGSATTWARAATCRRSTCSSTGRTCSP